jgi:kumamolisin
VYKKLKVKGQGVTLGLFELSNYKKSDIPVYEKTFNLSHVPVIDKTVLGGPTPINGSADYGAGEVELDIELQIAMAPSAKSVLLYNAPNTELGVIGEYLQIAKDNRADAISTSWGSCEYFTTTTVQLGELQAFTQMALQGQSIFAAAGDDGAFSCGPSAVSGLSNANALQAIDPASSPFMTAVGGTSFRKQNGGAVLFDPGKNTNPDYPGATKENAWNAGCTADTCNGAGGGGVSRLWASTDYTAFNGNILPGILEPGYSQTGTYCKQTPANLCREVPDVSIDADPGTGYAIYCTDPGDVGCQDPAYNEKGWVRFGGTSCGAPLWAGIAALYDSYYKERAGLFNFYVYPFDSTTGYQNQFHDITIGNNGNYPAGKNYDLATGIGTPNVYKLIKP